MATFREFGVHEDSDTALKTLERVARRLFLDVHQDELHVRMGPDAAVMDFVSIPMSQALSAVLERYRVE
eukprot:10450050-Lingulodinium_polyedra.AAC.1